MTKVNRNTKKAQQIISELSRNNYVDDIFKAYDKPSSRKVSSFLEIWNRAHATEGYNHDLHITGWNTCTYSTIYSYTVDGKTFVIKDTHADTYVVEM